MAAVIGSLVVGTDGSQTAAVAVARAVALARAFEARTVSVQRLIGTPPSACGAECPSRRRTSSGRCIRVTTYLRYSRPPSAKLARRACSRSRRFARVGDAADAILDVAEEQGSDLVVVGNKGMTGATRFLLGSVPNKVSHHAPCSVLIVRTSS